MKESGDDYSVRFEKDCLAIFDKLIRGYGKALQSGAWESNTEILVEKMSHLPTAPFPCKLMELFDYNYLALSEGIGEIIQKSLEARSKMEHTQRFIEIVECYYSMPFLPQNTHLKRLEVFNNEGELCYRLKGNMRIRFGKLLSWLVGNKKVAFQDVFAFRQKTSCHKKLEIYCYSPFVDLESTDPKDYYSFFCDYYGKKQFVKYISAKEKLNISPTINPGCTLDPLRNVTILTSSQQVLWAYFFFKLMGLNLRINLEVATLTRFLHIVNKTSLDGYKNSYFYKLVSKAPYVKKDSKLLADLETIRVHFQESKLPADDIEIEMLNLITK